MDLKKQFELIDKDKTGLITPQELKDYITSQKGDVDEQALRELMNELDYAGNGKINYSEFLAATVNT